MRILKPHKDYISRGKQNGGYSIRIGNKVPENSANLAYVSTKPVTPSDNILLEDRSGYIQENGLPTYMEKEMLVFPGKTMKLESEGGEALFPSDNIFITDEFTIPKNKQDVPQPLYFRMECRGLFDARSSYVLPYEGGRSSKTTAEAIRFEQIQSHQLSDLLYVGDSIRIQDTNELTMPSTNAYKIHLIQDKEPWLYRVVVYSNFKGDDAHSYKVMYPAYEDGKSKSKEEVLNTYPFFERKTYEELKPALDQAANGEWSEALSKKEYAIVKKNDGYEVYATSNILIANTVTRPPQLFKYRTEAQLKTKLSDINPGTLNIGVMYLNKAVYNVENLSSIGKRLNTSSMKPGYLTLKNPHPKDPSWQNDDVRYWTADLDMPSHYYYDYDVLILTGYGAIDMSAYRDFFEEYLSQGGTIWVDNAGAGVQALSFVEAGQNTFVTNIGFGTENETGSKRMNAEHGFLNRLYTLPSLVNDLGYEGIANKIVFGTGESVSNWNVLVQYGNSMPALMTRTIYDKGTLVVSNCGIMRAIHHNDELDMKVMMNSLLTIAENQWFATPWRQDYVFHRDNLFEQEYYDVNGNQVYVDDRNDIDTTQIVAKKHLGKTARETLLPHVKDWFQTAKGTYTPVIDSDNEVPVENNDFESVTVDANGIPVTSWTTTTANAIPRWSTKLFAGSNVVFQHIDNISTRGVKSILLDSKGTGAQAFWESDKVYLPADSYELRMWIKTENVKGISTDGAKFGVFKPDGTAIATTIGIVENRNWIRLELPFHIGTAQDVQIRIGFVDGNGTGKVYADNLTLMSLGSVHITPPNDGSKSLYAYAVNPKGETVDIEVQGFVEEDIKRIQPVLPFTLMIRSFVYKWENLTRRYERVYGNTLQYPLNVSKSEGVKIFGHLHTMLPALNAGAEWNDKNRVYYELLAYGEDGFINPLVNLSLYDTESGHEYYLKNGELVIGYMDLFWAKLNPTILVQAHTPYETIRASRRHFGLKLANEDRVWTELPRTKDSKESWFLRIHNGAFFKNELGYEEWSTLSKNKGQTYVYEKRTMKKERYSIPEYEQQVFHPYEGIKSVENEVEYINRRTVRVPHNNLFVEWLKVSMEEAKPIGGERKVFEASRERWDEREPVQVYVDENGNGTFVLVETGYDIDFEKGLIIFEKTVVGNVKVTYSVRNLRLYKRTYSNGKIANELLHTDDNKTYVSKRPFWLYEPAPILKTKPGLASPETIISPVEYTINYETGVTKFYREQPRSLYADYSYYTQKEIEIEDYDVQNGTLYLKNEIDFRDDLYAVYSYEEEFYDYRGYYDEVQKRFMFLDLNPSNGHFSTLPSTRYIDGKPATMYKEVPSSQLLNKEIHVYFVPESTGGASIRHCFSALEWQKIQQTNPMFLLLAKVFVREHTSVEQTIVMDARTQGGGLKESITEKEITKRVQGRQRYWDIGSWNGKAYYRNGTMVVSLPKTVLKSNGGYFTEEQVQEIVDKYAAYGTYIIIEYL